MKTILKILFLTALPILTDAAENLPKCDIEHIENMVFDKYGSLNYSSYMITLNGIRFSEDLNLKDASDFMWQLADHNRICEVNERHELTIGYALPRGIYHKEYGYFIKKNGTRFSHSDTFTEVEYWRSYLQAFGYGSGRAANNYDKEIKGQLD